MDRSVGVSLAVLTDAPGASVPAQPARIGIAARIVAPRERIILVHLMNGDLQKGLPISGFKVLILRVGPVMGYAGVRLEWSVGQGKVQIGRGGDLAPSRGPFQ